MRLSVFVSGTLLDARARQRNRERMGLRELSRHAAACLEHDRTTSAADRAAFAASCHPEPGYHCAPWESPTGRLVNTTA
jgi:hypothetical protein